METTLYYYTGTGNSLWTARTLAGLLGETEVLAMAGLRDGPVEPPTKRVGLVFPVHIWGLPHPVVDFVRRLSVPFDTYLFAIAVNAGQVSRTLVQLEELCRSQGKLLQSGISVALPSNYIPWGGPGPEEKLSAMHADARRRIEAYAPIVRDRQPAPVDRGPLWQRVLFTALYRMSWGQVPQMDKSFWTDAKCDGCGICAKVCPCGNIVMTNDRPVWQHRCEQCLACIQWCPKEALQYGKKTPAYPRYRHPEVRVADLVKAKRG
jgi:ferredoxin